MTLEFTTFLRQAGNDHLRDAAGRAHDMRKYMHGDEIIVAGGQVLRDGDNRDRSLDSRYWDSSDRMPSWDGRS